MERAPVWSGWRYGWRLKLYPDAMHSLVGELIQGDSKQNAEGEINAHSLDKSV